MCGAVGEFDNRLSRMQTEPTDTRELTLEIAALLESPDGGAEAPSLSELEDTLTTGYARALILETERERIQRELTDAATGEGHDLRARLDQVQESLAELRRALVPLRSRARTARTLFTR
jgi:hypothetical protein